MEGAMQNEPKAGRIMAGCLGNQSGWSGGAT